MNFLENITFRRVRTQSDSNTNDVSSVINETLDDTIHSLPDLSSDDINDPKHDIISKLMQQIDKLTLDLKNAHQEIESLSLDNKNLIKLSDELRKKNDSNETTCSPAKISAEVSTPNKYEILIKKLNDKDTSPSDLSLKQTSQSPTLYFQDCSTNKGEANYDARNSAYVLESSCGNNEITNNPYCAHQVDARTKVNNVKQGASPRRVMIFADENGKGISIILQKLLGSEFSVTAIVKPYASTKHIVESCSSICKGFTSQDYVIVLTGSNDKDPIELQSLLYSCLTNVTHTNVLLGTIFCNTHLNVHKLNNSIKYVCSRFTNARVLEWSTFLTDVKNMYLNRKIEVCRHILRDILQLNYKIKYEEYCKIKVSRKQYKNACTQTISSNNVESPSPHNKLTAASAETNTTPSQHEQFFRNP